MLDALAAALAFAAVVALAMAALYAVTVVPFLLTVGAAERRGLAPGRWAAAALVAVVLALGLALLLALAGAGALPSLLPLALAFAPFAVVRSAAAERLGRAGRHEQPL